MNPLAQMNSQQRGIMLAKMFPDERVDFLRFAKAYCIKILEGKNMYKELFDGHRLSREEWKEMASETIIEITNYYIISPYTFGEALFKYSHLLFTCFLLEKYIAQKKVPTQEFRLAIQLLFLSKTDKAKITSDKE